MSNTEMYYKPISNIVDHSSIFCNELHSLMKIKSLVKTIKLYNFNYKCPDISQKKKEHNKFHINSCNMYRHVC